MGKQNKKNGVELVSSVGDVQKEIDRWESQIAGKEDEESELSIQIQNIKIPLNVFLGRYNSEVGLLYVKLDKIQMKIREHRLRIDLDQGKKSSQDHLDEIEEEVNETFSSEGQKINDLEDETCKSSEEYGEHLEQEEASAALDDEDQAELKTLFRKLALIFHPDRAGDEKKRKENNGIMAAITEAYKNKDLRTLREYMERAEPEERIV